MSLGDYVRLVRVFLEAFKTAVVRGDEEKDGSGSDGDDELKEKLRGEITRLQKDLNVRAKHMSVLAKH
jgi:hypothetical protein